MEEKTGQKQRLREIWNLCAMDQVGFLLGWLVGPISVRWPEDGDKGGHSIEF